MHSISTTNKNGQLVAALLWGYLGRVFPHRASATFGTPSVTAKAVRAPRRWCNCVVSVKRIFVIVCKHPYDIPFTEICTAYPPQTKNGQLAEGQATFEVENLTTKWEIYWSNGQQHYNAVLEMLVKNTSDLLLGKMKQHLSASPML